MKKTTLSQLQPGEVFRMGKQYFMLLDRDQGAIHDLRFRRFPSTPTPDQYLWAVDLETSGICIIDQDTKVRKQMCYGYTDAE